MPPILPSQSRRRRLETVPLLFLRCAVLFSLPTAWGFQPPTMRPIHRSLPAGSNHMERYRPLHESKKHAPSLSNGKSQDEQSAANDAGSKPLEDLEDMIVSFETTEEEDTGKGMDDDVIIDRDKIENSSLPKQRRGKKKLELMWCAEDVCKGAIRERVSGDRNQIILDGPATGQVAYYWEPEEEILPKKVNGVEKVSDADTDSDSKETTEPAILLLVKPNDADLIYVAARAVKQLTNESNNINVYMDASLAGKLKFSHAVDNERIRLFEPEGTEGFGGNHVGLDDKRMSDFSGLPQDFDPPFDLICTLGGDGLLMHASMLFQGPVPPVLSIAGGSLGFLTQFSKEEMVDAIRIALGLSHEELKREETADGMERDTFRTSNSLAPKKPTYPNESLPKGEGIAEVPRFSFGSGDVICLSIRMRLDCRIFNREGVLRARFNVLNEVVIDRGSSPYLANLECFCDDVHLTTVQADGVIFATPTGSTAYSMAAGGSVVHPAVPCILVTPICPHVLSFRSMIFPDHVVLRCYVPDDARSDASVAFDGRYRRILHRGDSLEIQMSAYPVPTLNRADHSSDWLGSLKRSFNFNTRPRQKPL